MTPARYLPASFLPFQTPLTLPFPAAAAPFPPALPAAPPGGHLTRDVIILGGAAGGVHQAHGALLDIVGLQGADEQLVVGTVDGVAALRQQQGAHTRQQ